MNYEQLIKEIKLPANEDGVGIYAIHCINNDYVYIGSSRKMRERLNTHLKKLRYKLHANHHMQNCYNLYGNDCFEYKILENCECQDLAGRENYYISLIDKDKRFNMAPVVAKGEVSEEWKAKIAKTLTGRITKPWDEKRKEHYKLVVKDKRLETLMKTRNTPNYRQSDFVLTWENVLEIRKLYKEGKTQKFLAEKFGVTAKHIGKIVRKECWKYIEDVE